MGLRDWRPSCRSDSASTPRRLWAETPVLCSDRRLASSGPNPECGQATGEFPRAMWRSLRARDPDNARAGRRPGRRCPSARQNRRSPRKSGIARGNIERAIVLQLQQHGKFRGRAGPVKYSPMEGCTSSGFPVGCMWTFSTRSVPGSARQAMPSGSTQGVPPGFQNRKWLSGSKVSDSMFRSMPGKPAPGVFSCMRAERLRSISTLA